MAKTAFYVIKNSRGSYDVRKPGSLGASAVGSTQDEAVIRARRINPSADVYVERILKPNVGGRDKWRKVS